MYLWLGQNVQGMLTERLQYVAWQLWATCIFLKVVQGWHSRVFGLVCFGLACVLLCCVLFEFCFVLSCFPMGLGTLLEGSCAQVPPQPVLAPTPKRPITLFSIQTFPWL